MKITFYQTNQFNSVQPVTQAAYKKQGVEEPNLHLIKDVPSANLSLVNFPNVSFKMKPDMEFLLKQSDKLMCAYSGKPMISPFDAKKIYQKLEKRPNAISAINLLQQYTKYMHEVESEVFDFFVDAAHKSKRNFQDILKEQLPESLERLKEKQRTIIGKADRMIFDLSVPIAERVIAIRDAALDKVDAGMFGRNYLLGEILKIKAKNKDAQKLTEIYRTLYDLPRPSKDFDAFVVHYSKQPHKNIAKRLLSSAVATVEHVKPQSRNGGDLLGNYLLVSAGFNSERSSMQLDDYIVLNDDLNIIGNIQHYIDAFIEEVNGRNAEYSARSYYPEQVVKSINGETRGNVHINTDKLSLTKKQKRENESHHKLEKKYNVNRK